METIYNEITKTYTCILSEEEYRLYSGWSGRKVKVLLGKARRRLAGEIDKRIISPELRRQRYEYLKFNRSQGLTRQQLNRDLEKYCEETLKTPVTNSRISFGSSARSSDLTIHRKDVPESYPLKGIREAASRSRDYFISHPKGSSAEILAHEAGHVIRNREGGLLSRLASDPRRRKELSESQVIKTSGILKGLKNGVSGSIIEAEETRATKEGIKLLKKLGATPKELEDAKKSLSYAGGSYRSSRILGTAIPIRNKIQIPSRRGEFISPQGKKKPL